MRSLVLMLIAVLALPAAAAASTSTVERSRHLWATVNACDTKRKPDTLGVRASMPGLGRRDDVMYMRFRAQYRPAGGTWRYLSPGRGDSDWQRVGLARYKALQAGWDFTFDLASGQRYEMRGVVRFEWRRRGRVVRHAIKRTTAGHRTASSDPDDYSAATCTVAG